MTGDGTLAAARDLVVRLGDREVLGGIDLEVRPGEFLLVAGPNGAGKTTLLRALAGVLAPAGGEVRLLGAPAVELPRREAARRVAYLPQEDVAEQGLLVREVVALGRWHRLGVLGAPGTEDREALERALVATDTAHLADRRLGELSGGERRRVLVARALAQEAPLLVLDEPTTGLDAGHACELVALLAGLASRGRGVVVSLHDLFLAGRGPDRAVLLDGGRVTAEGDPLHVLTGEAARRAFGIPLVAGPGGSVVPAPGAIPLRRPHSPQGE